MAYDSSPIKFNSNRNNDYGSDTKSKPTGAAGDGFKKIMSKNEQGGKSNDGRKHVKDDEEEESPILIEEEATTQGPVSLFDMSKMQGTRKKTLFKSDVEGQAQLSTDQGETDVKFSSRSKISSYDEKPQESFDSLVDAHDAIPTKKEPTKLDSPFTVASHTSQTSKANTPPPKEPIESIEINTDHIGKVREIDQKAEHTARPFDLIATAGVNEKISDTSRPVKNKNNALFASQEKELNAVNPLAGIQQNTDSHINLNVTAEKPVLPVKSIQEIINQMVKEVQSMEAQGKTDTTITLRHPPIFEGAQVTVTAFDSARGQFNISFEKLSSAANELLSQQGTKENLLLALEQKGYQVHILTVTTLDEQRLFSANVDDTQKERDRNSNGNQQQGRNRDQDEPDA